VEFSTFSTSTAGLVEPGLLFVDTDHRLLFAGRSIRPPCRLLAEAVPSIPKLFRDSRPSIRLRHCHRSASTSLNCPQAFLRREIRGVSRVRHNTSRPGSNDLRVFGAALPAQNNCVFLRGRFERKNRSASRQKPRQSAVWCAAM